MHGSTNSSTAQCRGKSAGYPMPDAAGSFEAMRSALWMSVTGRKLTLSRLAANACNRCKSDIHKCLAHPAIGEEHALPLGG